MLPDTGIVDILSRDVCRSARMSFVHRQKTNGIWRLYSRSFLPLSSARIILSSKSGLEGGLDELRTPELVGVDG